MPHKFEKEKNNLPKDKDRRVKLTDTQRDEIRVLGSVCSQRELAKKFDVSRRTIQFILDPSKLEENLKRRKERGGSKIYYDKDKNTVYMRNHRQYKKSILNEENA